MIRIVIADDQALIRESLRVVLNINPDMEVAGVAANGVQLLQFLEKQAVDVILMDVRMPQMDGVLATKAVKERWPSIKIIILTTFDDDEYVLNGLKYGASGYLLKGITVPELSEAIRNVMAGEAMLNKDIVTKVVRLFNSGEAQAGAAAASSGAAMSQQERQEREKGFEIEVDDLGAGELTRTERNIARLTGRGLSNKEIAEKLCLAEGTIRNGMSVTLSKLALRDRTQLAIWAVQTGLSRQPVEE